MVLAIIYSMIKGEFIIALLLVFCLYLIWINPSFNPKKNEIYSINLTHRNANPIGIYDQMVY